MSSPTTRQGDLKQSFWTPKRVARLALFLALSAVGAFIKIPSPIGTIGLDSAPGYFSAAAFGWGEGGLVTAIGHLLSAAVVGFPLSIPIHLLIAVAMFLFATVFWYLWHRVGAVVAVVVGTLLNGLVSPFLLIPVGGLGLTFSMMLPLTVAAGTNIIIAAIAYKIVQRSNMV